MLVRRLDLGLIRLGAPSQTLALRIEAALRGITPLRLRAGDVAPPDAPAISFHDRAEALAALLIAARRGALRGWWWARLLPAAAQSTLPVLMPAALAAAVREGGFTLVAAIFRFVGAPRTGDLIRLPPHAVRLMTRRRSSVTFCASRSPNWSVSPRATSSLRHSRSG